MIERHDHGIGDTRLTSERIQLRLLYPEDMPFLYQLSLGPENQFRWRFRSEQPTYADFVRMIGAGVFCQYVVVLRGDKRRIGLAVCYQANRTNRTAYIGVVGDHTTDGSGALVEAGHLLVTHLFECFDFEKLYAECLEYNLDAFRSGMGNDFVEEGRLVRHERLFGRAWDLHILALHREHWHATRERMQRRATSLTANVAGESGPLFEEFSEVLFSALGLEPQVVTAASRLNEDLGFDSITMFEVADILEEFDATISDSEIGSIRTLGDLHFLFLQNRRRGEIKSG